MQQRALLKLGLKGKNVEEEKERKNEANLSMSLIEAASIELGSIIITTAVQTNYTSTISPNARPRKKWSLEI